MDPTTSASETSENAYLQYRSISLSAIATLILAMISVPSLLFSGLLVLPAIGIIVGSVSFLRIRGRESEFVGLPVARLGLIACFLILICGSVRAGYEYATEVPDGYERISFTQLQPDEKFPQLPIPPAALELDGKQVFVKGYVHPGVDRRKGIKHFVLVPDMKTCCFGGQPALTDMIEVTITSDETIDYSYTKRKLAGTLYVSPYKKQIAGLDGVYYRMDVKFVR